MTTKKERVSDERVVATKYPTPATYAVPYNCSNCGWSGNLRVDKGTTAPGTRYCPICECNTAKKSIMWPLQTRKEPHVVEKDPVLIPIIPGAWPKNPIPYPRPHRPDRPDITWRQAVATENDIDNVTRFRGEPHTGFGLELKTRENFRVYECGVRDGECL